jgi:hypothetical protein
VSNRKNQFAVVGPYVHHDLSGDLRHTFAIANRRLKIAEGVAVKLVDLGFRDRFISDGKFNDAAHVCTVFINSSTAALIAERFGRGLLGVVVV